MQQLSAAAVVYVKQALPRVSRQAGVAPAELQGQSCRGRVAQGQLDGRTGVALGAAVSVKSSLGAGTQPVAGLAEYWSAGCSQGTQQGDAAG